MQGGLGGGTVSMRPGIDAGESYVREVAAYMLVRHIYIYIYFLFFFFHVQTSAVCVLPGDELVPGGETASLAVPSTVSHKIRTSL